MGETDQVTFALTLRELADYNRWCFRNVPALKRQRMVRILVAVAIGFYLYWNSDFYWVVFGFTTVPIIILGTAYILWDELHVIRTQAKQNPWLLEQQSARIQESGLHVETTLASAEYKWPKITRIVDTGTLLLFFLTDRMAYSIPKRAFDSPTQAQAFYEKAIDYRDRTLYAP
jgi:hypothetical protein